MEWMRCASARTKLPKPGRTQTVFLVRHAESQQNIATEKLKRGDLRALADIIALGYDAPLSPYGEQQAADAAPRGMALVRDRGVEVVAHSPLQRARATAIGFFSNTAVPLVQLPFLYERTLTEFAARMLLDLRICELRSWIEQRPEQTIAVVGHGQFFARLGRRDGVQANASVLEYNFEPTRGFEFVSEVLSVPPRPSPE